MDYIKENSHGQPRKAFTERCASGFSHFQPSGTGAIGAAVIITSKFSPAPRGLERARSVTCCAMNRQNLAGIADIGPVAADITLGQWLAAHRYVFSEESERALHIDLCAGGLLTGGKRSRPERLQVIISGQWGGEYICDY